MHASLNQNMSNHFGSRPHMEHTNVNRHSQPTQRPTGHSKPVIDSHTSASSSHCQQESLRPRACYSDDIASLRPRLKFADYSDDIAIAKAQGTAIPTKPVPAAFRYIASKRTCDPAGKLASILRQQEAAEGRKLQAGKKNKIPDPQQKKAV
jgi:hypothetical protein